MVWKAVEENIYLIGDKWTPKPYLVQLKLQINWEVKTWSGTFATMDEAREFKAQAKKERAALRPKKPVKPKPIRPTDGLRAWGFA